jgi:hypothetical protein
MNLPFEIVERIFLALDARDLISACASCNTHREILFDPTFVRHYLCVHHPRLAITGQVVPSSGLINVLLNEMNVVRLVRHGQLDNGPFSDRLCHHGLGMLLLGVDTFDRLLREPHLLGCGSLWVCQEWRRTLNTSFVLHEWNELTSGDGAHRGPAFGAVDDVEYGFALIASSFAPHVNLCDVFARLDELAALIEDSSDGLVLLHRAMDIMRAQDIGPAFGERYYELNNSLLHLLLRNGGRGIPVSLSMVLRSLLLRKHVKLSLLDMPGHYVMSYEADNGSRWIIDVYNFTVQVRYV